MKIVLLSYLNRSGSTYLFNQLSKIPGICVCPEADILYELLLEYPGIKLQAWSVGKWKDLLENDFKFRSWDLPLDDIICDENIGKSAEILFLDILKSYQERNSGGSELIFFKQNYLYKTFPRLQTLDGLEIFGISLIRDPRAVYNSQKRTRTPQNGKLMCNNPLLLTDEWNNYIEVTNELTVSNSKYISILYEDMILKSESTFQEIFQFLKTDISSDHRTKNNELYISKMDIQSQKIHPNIHQAPLREKIHAWKDDSITPNEIHIIEKRARLNQFYHLDNNSDGQGRPYLFFILQLIKAKWIFLYEKIRRFWFRFRFLNILSI